MRKVLKNGWKRVCAAILAAAMTVTMLPANAQAAATPAKAATETVELVQNGDFEKGTTGWEGIDGGELELVSADNGTGKADNHVLRVKNRKNSSSSAKYDFSGMIKKGTTYTIKGRMKYDGEDVVATKNFTARFQNAPEGAKAPWNHRPAIGTIALQKGVWKTFEFTYTADDWKSWDNNIYEFGTGSNFFFIEGSDYANNTQAAEAPGTHLMDYYLDDISITYEKAVDGEEPEVDELLSNGSFEIDPIDKNWVGMGIQRVERVENIAHEGNASLKVTGYSAAWQGARYNLTDLLKDKKMVAGKKYTLTAWAKSNSGSGQLLATIKGIIDGKDSYGDFSNPKGETVNSDGWTKISWEITLRDYDMDELFIYWHWSADTGVPTEFYLDDVSLTTPSENIVRNGSFEKGLEKWEKYGEGQATTVVTAVSDEAHTGSQSAKVTNRTKCDDGLAQDVSGKLTPGSNYTVSAWVKYTGENAPATKAFNLTLQHGGKYTRTLMASGEVKKGEWTKIEADWDMPYGTAMTENKLFVETPFAATPNANNDLMDFYVDDVSVIENPYEDTSETLAKKFGYGNPITTHEFGADPYAIEYNGRVYVYMTADDYEFSDKDNPYSNNFGYITSLRVVSSADLMNWTDHGEIEVAGRNGGKGPAMWASHAWAPAIAHKEINGEDKFFLYFANDASGIGVLTAPTPVGPWTDPTVDAQNPNGHALITKATPGCADVEWCFDPAVLVDDGGEAYIYFGGGVPTKDEQLQHNNPKTARVAKLGEDMISLDGAAVEIDAPCMFEDSGIFKYNNKYYYSYCSNFTATTVDGYPGTGNICYMMSDNPMGPFKYAGEIFSNPQTWFGVGGNNHHATFVFNGKSYFIYHAQTVSKALGVERGYRSTHIDEIELDDEGKIKEIKGTYKGIPQLAPMDAYERRIEAETIAWNAGVKASATGREGGYFAGNNMVLTDLQEGDWTALSQVDFGSKGADKVTVSVGSKDGGTIEVRKGTPDGTKIGEIEVPETGSNHTYKLVTGDIQKVTGIQNIFFVFHQKKTGATTATYQAELQSLWAAVKTAEGSLPLREQLKRQITKGHNVSSGFAWNETAQKNALDAKVNAAQAVADNGSATDEQLTAAIAELNEAIETADQYKATEKLLKEKLKYRIKYAEQLVELNSMGAAQKPVLQAAIDSAKQLLRDDSIMNVDYYQFTEEGGTPPSEEDKTVKEQLSEKITAANDLLEELSGAKKTALAAAIEEAKGVLDDEDASEADITAALGKLNTAIEEAQKPEEVTVKTRLEKKILEAKNMLANLSDTKKAALQAVITEVEGVLNDESASDEDIEDALDKLNEAIAEAQKPDVGEDTPAKQLEAKIQTAKDMLANLSDAKKAALQAAIEEAEGVLSDEDSSDADITAALGKLNTAIGEAQKPDVGEDAPAKQLEAKIQTAKDMLANLSDARKAALQAAIEEAEGVLNDENASDEDIEDALDKLNEAIGEAQKPDVGEDTPAKQLEAKIQEAKDMLASLSADKKAALEKVIGEVEAVLNNESASEKDITDALDKLNTAIEDAKKSDGQTEDEKAGLNQTFTETSGLTFKVTGYSENVKTVTVTGANSQLASITIPDTVVYRKETFTVTAIADSAFENQANLTSVTIGKNVTTIGAKAFMNAKKLKSITFQGTAVTTIGKDAFKNIDNKAAFTMTKTFTSKNLKYKITKSTASALEVSVTGASKKLTSVSIPATVKFNGMSFKVTSVDKNAFKKQTKLKSVTIGKNVKSIGANAFSGDKKLAKIKFSGTAIKSIGKNAFKGIKKNAKFNVKKSKKAAYKKLLKKAKTKNFKI